MIKIPTTARLIFAEFCHRNNLLTREMATVEFDQWLTVNGRIRLKDSYLTVRRVGAGVTLSRAQRQSVYLTFENALNHAIV